MKHSIIAVDCDDVLVGTAHLILQNYNKQYGTQLTERNYYPSDFAAWNAPSDEEVIGRISEYMSTPEFMYAQPFRDAVDVLSRLMQRYELHLVTGRADFLAEATEWLLLTHFPGVFSSSSFTDYFGNSARTKADVCKHLGATLLIDDHLRQAETAASEGIEVYLFGDYAWNRAESLRAGITRVKDWHDVEKLLA